MASNALSIFVKDWTTRANQANQAGISTSELEPIFQMDLQRLKQGSTPLTNEQVDLALASSHKGGPVLTQGQGKPNWNPVHLLGRAVSDIGEVGKGLITLPKAIAHDVSHIGEMPGQIAKGAGEIAKGKFGEGLQDIASAPGLQEILLASDFIPGVDAVTAPITAAVLAGGVAGKALTPAGRKDIASHPLVNALNLLPAAKELGATGALSDALSKTALDDHVTKAMQDLGVDKPSRDVWRLFSDARKQAHNQVSGFFDQAAQMFGRHTPEEMTQITNLLKEGDPQKIQAAEAQFPGITEIKQNYDLLQKGLSDNEELFHLPDPTSGVTEVVPKSSIPARAWQRLGRTKDTLATHTEAYKASGERLKTLQSQAAEAAAAVPKAEDIIQKLKPAMDAEIERKGLAQSRLAPALDAIRKERYGVAAGMLRRMGLGSVADEVSKVPQLRTQAERSARALQLEKEKALSLYDKVDKAKKAVRRQEKLFQTAYRNRPPARWQYNVSEDFHNQVQSWAQAFYSGDPKRLDAAMAEVAHRYYGASFEDGTPMFPPAELNRMLKDSEAKIAEWQKAGWNPSFVHSVTETQLKGLRYPQVAKREAPAITSLKERVLLSRDASEEVSNVALSLTHQQAEIAINELWNNAWNGYTTEAGEKIPGILERVGKTQDQIVSELRARGLSPAEALKQVREDWENPKRSAHINTGPFAKNNILIPKSLAKNIDRLTPTANRPTHLKAMFDKGTRGYRFAVTGLSPQHVVHVVASGGVMFGAAMRDLPTVLRSVGEARQLVKEIKDNPRSLAAIRISQEASQLPEEDAMLFGARDRTAARLYSSVVAKGVHPLQRLNAAMNHFDEHVTSWYKALDYVSQTKHGLDPEAALYEVGKHFADHAGRSPLERAIFKSYVPFGSWTQHLIRYTFTFPADHPVRASILANLATAELEDQTNGLPRNFAQMFFLGDKAFDIRQFNPFRDIGNDFDLRGFIAALNPAADALIRSTGYDPIAGTAELYPDLQVDPNSGKLVTQNKSVPKLLAEAFVPQSQGVEALLGWSDSMRNLKASDPSAYWSTLARYLHFPWLPRTINIPQERAKEQLNLLRVAQQDVSQAEKTQKWGQADEFNLVPFGGTFVKPEQLQQLFARLQLQSGSLPAKDILPKVR